MKVLILLLAITGCMSRPLFDSHLDQFWNAYKENHGKIYANQPEEHMRRLIWEHNLEFIRKHNLEADLGIHSHRLGINEHADLTDDEYNTGLKGFIMSNRTTAPTFMASENTVMPTSVDWRQKGYVTPIKNQARCGSCWAFSTTGSLEGQHFKKTGKLVSLSEQNLIDCSKPEGNHGCEGGSMDGAFKYIKMNGGIDTESSYPYMAKNGMCHFMKNDIGATDMGYMNIPHMDEMALANAVATVGPISVAIDASKKDFRFYKTGVFTSHECSSTKLDHGVLAVGYGTEMDEDYWIVKNSWGTSWGDMGFIKMRRNYHNMCGIASMASYPIV